MIVIDLRFFLFIILLTLFTIGWGALKAARQWSGRNHPTAPLPAPPGGRVICALTLDQIDDASRGLINDLAHELRTPLAAILAHSEVLNRPETPEDVARQSGRLLREEGRRMARLIHQLLDLGSLETSREISRRPLDLLTVIEEAVAQVSGPANQQGITVSIETPEFPPLILGDSDLLRQVFLNLLDNAVKYCRFGDRVVVRLEPTSAGLLCSVQDNGPGIPARHLPFLSRRFYRAAAAGVEGNGLGLALVAEVLRRHNSKLEIESGSEAEAAGQSGTCVRFVLATDEG